MTSTDFDIWVCHGCYRQCSVRVRYSAGTPPQCPYGLNQNDYELKDNKTASLDFYTQEGEL